MSIYVTLFPKSNKAHRIFDSAGRPEKWIVTRIRQEVDFSDRKGPWYYCVPLNGKEDHARYVNKEFDLVFEMQVLDSEE
jgi:hypothetical protein